MNPEFVSLIYQLPPYVSWGQFTSGKTITKLLPKEHLIPFLEFILKESEKNFPDPQIIAAGILYLEKSGYQCKDIAKPAHKNAIEVLCRKYSFCQLNPIRSGENPVFLHSHPLPDSRVYGDTAGVP